MPLYNVYSSERIYYKTQVEADSEDEAREKVENGIISVTQDDSIDSMDFYVSEAVLASEDTLEKRFGIKGF